MTRDHPLSSTTWFSFTRLPRRARVRGLEQSVQSLIKSVDYIESEMRLKQARKQNEQWP